MESESSLLFMLSSSLVLIDVVFRLHNKGATPQGLLTISALLEALLPLKRVYVAGCTME